MVATTATRDESGQPWITVSDGRTNLSSARRSLAQIKKPATGGPYQAKLAVGAMSEAFHGAGMAVTQFKWTAPPALAPRGLHFHILQPR